MSGTNIDEAIELPGDLLNDILSSSTVRAVVCSDRAGRLLKLLRGVPEEAAPLVEGADIAFAALDAMAAAQELGGVQTTVVRCEQGVVVMGRLTENAALYVLATEKANLGLLLSQVTRVAARGAGVAQ